MGSTRLNCTGKENVILCCHENAKFRGTKNFRKNKFTFIWINIRENAKANIFFQPKHGQIFKLQIGEKINSKVPYSYLRNEDINIKQMVIKDCYIRLFIIFKKFFLPSSDAVMYYIWRSYRKMVLFGTVEMGVERGRSKPACLSVKLLSAVQIEPYVM